MKKIAIMPVKNEEWILEHTLTCASLFFDHIIVADQQSTDRTPEICAQFPKVVYVKNDTAEYNEGNRRQLLLNAARQFPGHNFIANLAADEIFSANLLEPGVFEKMVEGVKPGTAFAFQWVQLWRSEKVYRDDTSVWSNLVRPFAFIDDRTTNFKPGFAHLSIVPEAYMESAIAVDHVKVLHYQFVDFDRMLMKQRWGRLLEYGKYPQPRVLKSIILNNKYYITKNEHKLATTPVPGAWTAGYPAFTIAVDYIPWHVPRSIEFIKEYGPANLRWLDIWDYTWPDFPDTRNFLQRWYHRHQYCVLVVVNSTPLWLKDLVKKLRS